MRDIRKIENLKRNSQINNVWENLTSIQKDVLQYISNKGLVKTSDILSYTGRSKPTIIKILKEFEELDIIEWIGTNVNDPQKKYRLK